MPTATPVTDFEHKDATRKLLPPAGTPPGERVKAEPKVKYAYDPHRTPELRFNERIVRCRELLEKATRTSLTRDEAAELGAYLESDQPWLEWAGKRELPDFAVEPVALHIHERVSAQAILRTVRREDAQRDFFAEPKLSAKEARAWYQHEVTWTNRLILGDSLQVMTSLARREGLAGKVQMVYFDPPYGIKFSSNWQNEVGKRDVKDKDEDLSREPEMIKAYRDTWALGVHSYLAYLKQRLLVARELLTESGSIFVQISDENLHRVRLVMDEVFGPENFCGQIVFSKTGLQATKLLPSVADFIIWYARDKARVRYRQLTQPKTPGEEGATGYTMLYDAATGFWRTMWKAERDDLSRIPKELHVFDSTPLVSDGGSEDSSKPFPAFGTDWRIAANNHWKTGHDGLARLLAADRIVQVGKRIEYRMMLADFGQTPRANIWLGLGERGFTGDKVYVVQTAAEAISRCLLMTTDPGDLVLDPTCGSGTTAFVAEQWGRRWITIDSSRVAAAIARQRLLTACFDTFNTKDPTGGVDPNQPLNPKHGFHYRTIPHVKLKSIAQNKGLDPIFARHEPILGNALVILNAALGGVTDKLREQLLEKLIVKVRTKGEKHTDADVRRWLLPETDPKLIRQRKGGPTANQVTQLRASIPPGTVWQEWEVPFDTDPDWPTALQEALVAYRKAWRAKMDEVNGCISANAEQEELVDQPEIIQGVVRVSGPFTVESVRPPENSPEVPFVESPIGGAPEELATFESPKEDADAYHPEGTATLAAANASSHIDRMLALLREDGITFLGNKHVKLARLDRVENTFIHAEGEFAQEDGREHRVAVVVGPEMGNVPSYLVEQAMRTAYKRGYDDLVVAGFGFDAMAQECIQDNNEDPNAEMRIHMALIRPDVQMGDLLKKTQVTAQIFTVFGQPRTRISSNGDEFTVHMEGVDIYDPVKNSIEATDARKVAAWFLDTDYDGKVFCICQAFFPDRLAWEKLSRALKGSIDEDVLARLSGTESLPFVAGARCTIAVKVIDPRGNEVMRVHRVKAN
ncbi:adenine-specific DNA-methyltransferase [Roseimicrobium gellanilyticum]|uniref:site-specific DNA-methyltransferase (adenine-specific) n=1 Tax=Roseimicrobium gellanilyticum TaxID=748857 RepID=A0A366HQK7_9BACT|nr:site-specific DNA-methyltransferase [Roseimicrobium gellanilyticum]RBP45213.1 adenine-specific DNA-methyltransferase [Roseimicrobium gellanilyticum]